MNKITKSFLMLLLTLVGVVSAQAQGWYSADKFTAKDYEGFTEVVSDEQWSPGSWQPAPQYYNDGTTVKMKKSQPEVAAARYDADGDYIEVKSNNMPVSDYDCQFWMQIPEELRANGTKVEVSLQAWVDDENGGDITVQPQIHAAPSAWQDNSNPKATFVAGKWTDLKYAFTINKNGVENYCFNLSDQKTEKARTYRFKNIKFAAAKEDWYYNSEFVAKDYEGFTEVVSEEQWSPGPWAPAPQYYNDKTTVKMKKSQPPFDAARYVIEDLGEAGTNGCIEVKSNGMPVSDYDSQLFIKISDKPLKANQIVKVNMKYKVDADVTVATQVHTKVDGWTNNPAPSLKFTVAKDAESGDPIDQWQEMQAQFDIENGDLQKEGNGVWFVLNLSDQKTEQARTYKFDDITFTVEDAPVLGWVDLIPLQNFNEGYTGEEDEIFHFLSKENVIKEGDTHRSRIVDTGEETYGKAIEFRTQAGASQPYDSQFEIRFPYHLPYGTKYKLEFDYKADQTCDFGTQVWDEAVGSWKASGSVPSMKVTEDKIGQWQHYSQELKVGIDTGIRWNVFDMAQSGQPRTIVFIDNIQVQVPEGTLPLKDGEGQEIAPDYLPTSGEGGYPVYEWTDPTSLDYTEELVTNGDLEDEDMDAFVAKIATEDDADPQILPVEAVDLEKYAVEGKDGDGRNGIAITALKQSENGSAAETQLWVRLNEVIPAGALYKVEFDVMSTNIADIPTQIDMNPGTNVSKDGIANGALGATPIKVAAAGEYLHYVNYCVAPEGGVGSIAFNLAGDKNYKYWFDNFSVKVPADVETEEVDEDLWDATLDLNVAVNAAKVVDTDGYSEESVKALEEAAKAGRELLDKADATKDALAAAAKDIEDAIAGLEYPYVEMPELDGSYIEIAQAQPTDFSIAATEAGEYNGDAYTTYTSPADVNVAFKMTDVDVTGCDKIYVYFAQPLKAGWNIAFWGIAGPAGVKAVDAGTEFIEFDLTEKLGDTEATYEQDGKTILKEVTLIDLWGATHPLTAKVYGVYKHEVAAPLADCDLTADMFFTWDAVDATAKTTGQPGCAYDINKSTGMPYGDGTVNEYNYADLSGFDHLAITATEGEPRLLFNRAAQDDHQGPLSVELPRDYGQNKYEAVVDNGDGSKTFVINLKEIVAKDGYAHLHAIKGANWANTTVTEMKLFVGESEYTDVLTAIEEVAEDAAVKDGKYFIDGQIVIVKNGVKYNAAGVVIQ